MLMYVASQVRYFLWSRSAYILADSKYTVDMLVHRRYSRRLSFLEYGAFTRRAIQDAKIYSILKIIDVSELFMNQWFVFTDGNAWSTDMTQLCFSPTSSGDRPVIR